MNKNLKRFLSVILSLAMVITSISYSPSQANAEESLTSMIANAEYNLALGKTATTGYEKFVGTEGNLAVITDGRTNTGRYYPESQENGSYEIDLGECYYANTIDRVLTVYNETNAETYPSKAGGFSIQFSADGKKYYEVASNAPGTYVKDTEFNKLPYDNQEISVTDENLLVRYVKIVYPDKYTYGVQVIEIAVLDLNNDAETVTPESTEVADVTDLNVTCPDDWKISVSFAASETSEVNYEVYIDEKLVDNSAVAGEDNVYENITAGPHIVKVYALNKNGFISNGIQGEVDVDGPLGFEEMLKMEKYNLAYNKSVTVHGDKNQEPENAPIAFLTDGILAKEGNYVTPTKKTAGTWHMINLGKTYDVKGIDKIIVWYRNNYGGCYPTSGGHEIQFSYDGKTFKTVNVISQAELDKQRNKQNASPFGIESEIGDVSAIIPAVKYVRILYPDSVEYGAQVTEVGIFDTNKDAVEYEGEIPTEEVTTETPTEEVTTETPTEAPTEEVTTEKPTEAPTEEVTTEKTTEAPTEYVDAPVTKLIVRNYGKFTGKYTVVFEASANAKTYNIYVDNTLVKNVKSSGFYITNAELAALSINDGDHTISVAAVDANGEESVKVTSGNIAVTGTTVDKAPNDDIEQVYIDTQNRDISKEYFKNRDGLITVNVCMTDGLGKGQDIIDAASDIKIRGNTTSGAEKKAYNIKLNKKQPAYGMDTAKKWSFLANAFDKSLVRNAVAQKLAADIGIEFTPQFKYVDIYCNGTYLGNYLMIESIEAAVGRVDINSSDATSTDALFEVDNNGRDVSEAYHINKSSMNVWLMMGEPEILPNDEVDIAANKVKIDYANDLIAKFEDALRNDDYEDIKEYIDVESFARFYILNEFMYNQDFEFSSTRFHIKNGKMYGGPCWDFDLSSGNMGNYYGDAAGMKSATIYKGTKLKWYEYLMANTEFRQLVAKLYTQYRKEIKASYETYIDSLMAQYKPSFERNWSDDELGAGWVFGRADQADGFSYANSNPWATYDDAVDYLKEWMAKRDAWMLSELNLPDDISDVALTNEDGSVKLSWKAKENVDHYEVTYTKYNSFDKTTYNANTEVVTKTVEATETTYVITDVLDNESTVTVKAVYGDETEEVIGSVKAMADITVSDIALSNPKALPGEKVTVINTVSNIGTAVAYPVRDVLAIKTFFGEEKSEWKADWKDPILPNENATSNYFNVQWTVAAGTTVLKTILDDRFTVPESNEANNTVKKSIYIDNEVARPTGVSVEVIDNIPTVTFSQSETEGVTSYEINVDGTPVKIVEAAGTFQLENIDPGTHTLTVVAVKGEIKSLATKAIKFTVEVPETTTEKQTTTKEEATTNANGKYLKKVVGFDYDFEGKAAGADLDEYVISEEDTYTYVPVVGAGTMQASLTGAALKHVSWSKAGVEFTNSKDENIGNVPSIKGTSKNIWAQEAFVTYTFSTIGYTGMTMSVDLGATADGPGKLKLVYVDDENAEHLISNITITEANKMQKYTFPVPAELENKESVTIAVKIAEMAAVDGVTTLAGSGGYLAFNNFDIFVETDEKPTEPPTQAPTEGPSTFDNSIVEFKYDGTGKVSGDDMVEYAKPSNDYEYYATAGNGVMTASMDGTETRHMVWGKSDDYGIILPLLKPTEDKPWTADLYVAYEFDTTGHSNLKASVQVAGTKKGPKNLVIGYYEGEEFKTIRSYSLEKNKVIYTVAFDLPETLENKANAKVYIKLANTTNIGGNEMLTEDYMYGGELAINNFVVTETSDTQETPIQNANNLTATATFDKVKATWNTPAGLTSNVYLYTADDTLIDSATGVTSYSKEGLDENTAYKIKVTTVRDSVESAGITTNIKTSKETEDMAITGYQMSTTLGENKDQIGIRTIYQREEMVEGMKVEEFGLVIGLGGEGHATDADMLVNGEDNIFVISNKATKEGRSDVQFGDSATARYYVMTMDTLGGYEQDYKVRAYAKLKDGTIVYSTVKTVNVYQVAKDLYDNKKMSTNAAHQMLYNEVIKTVDPDAQPVDYAWNNTLVKVSDKEEPAALDIVGMQMSSSLRDVEGDIGIRVVYEADGDYKNAEEIGLVYGLVYGDAPITAADMYVGNDNPYVVNYAATEAGKLDAVMGESSTANYYCNTMNVTGLTAAGYTVRYLVRAYAKLSNGEYAYSDVYTYSVADVAKVLYDNKLMSTYSGHNVIFNSIIKVVDESYETVDYNWNNAMSK